MRHRIQILTFLACIALAPALHAAAVQKVVIGEYFTGTW
jgi:hypothetical protein